uniref:Peroxiredoxin like 2C n=1 Tax=Marmota marmota marmota TaxID=9994 RepID=A0A8C6A7V7_MARMA
MHAGPSYQEELSLKTRWLRHSEERDRSGSPESRVRVRLGHGPALRPAPGTAPALPSPAPPQARPRPPPRPRHGPALRNNSVNMHIFFLLKEADVTLIVIGQSSYHHIEPFCKLTGYSHEIYVDPEREIYKRLGMKRGEEIASSGQSPHVKSNLLSGSLQSLWRAVTGPLFDFQGDPAQQGGTLIVGPGNNIHFMHRDRNRLDHKPINSVLQLVGVPHVNFTSRPSIIHV